MSTCASIDVPYFYGPVACEREDKHPGHHQNLNQGWAWNSGGGYSINVEKNYDCPTCGTHNVASDLRTTRAEGDQCFFCDFWDRGMADYRAGDSFVTEGHMYTLDPRNPNGFGGRKVIVHYADGRVVGPVAGLWHNGDIPHERRAVFPDNARIEWV